MTALITGGLLDWDDESAIEHMLARAGIQSEECIRETGRVLWYEEQYDFIEEQDYLDHQIAKDLDDEIQAERQRQREFPFTPNEYKIWITLGEVTKQFQQLDQTHPGHFKDWCDAIHKLQDIMGARTLQRLAPKQWASYQKRRDGSWQLRDGS